MDQRRRKEIDHLIRGFPAGQRQTRGGDLALELAQAQETIAQLRRENQDLKMAQGHLEEKVAVLEAQLFKKKGQFEQIEVAPEIGVTRKRDSVGNQFQMMSQQIEIKQHGSQHSSSAPSTQQEEDEELRSFQLAMELQREEEMQFQSKLSRWEGIQIHNGKNSMQMDTDVMTYEQLMDLEDSMGVVSRGLREEQRKQLLARRQTSRVDESANCSICLAGGDVEIELECGHQFHSECINEWLKLEKTCPLCKAELSVQ